MHSLRSHTGKPSSIFSPAHVGRKNESYFFRRHGGELGETRIAWGGIG